MKEISKLCPYCNELLDYDSYTSIYVCNNKDNKKCVGQLICNGLYKENNRGSVEELMNMSRASYDALITQSKELIQYYIVNKDLGMSTGKIAAQVGHASRMSALRDQKKAKYKEWYSVMMKTIILEAKESKIRKIQNQNPDAIAVIDNGLTEIPEGSMTVLVLPIMTRAESKSYVNSLQLLKEPRA